MCEALRDAWGPVFSRPPADDRTTEAILREHAARWASPIVESLPCRRLVCSLVRPGAGRHWRSMVDGEVPPAVFNSAIMT